MLPDLPWYGWLVIGGILTVTIIMKLPVYRKVFKKKKKGSEEPGKSGTD
ncbi:MAG: hypothetical protein JXB88_07595 [Spirochaetales bacterium]|nr:hypothetical protein [Spirochaetales bacterium]